MPITKQAIKKMHQDKKREAHNRRIKTEVKKRIKTARGDSTGENVKVAVSAIDRAAKKNIFHRNRAARLKSSLDKLVKTEKMTKSPKTKTKSKTSKTRKRA